MTALRTGWLAVAALPLAGVTFAQRSWDHGILKETFGFDENTKKTVSLEDLHQGCSRRDCIPSIDDPNYVPPGDRTFSLSGGWPAAPRCSMLFQPEQ